MTVEEFLKRECTKKVTTLMAENDQLISLMKAEAQKVSNLSGES